MLGVDKLFVIFSDMLSVVNPCVILYNVMAPIWLLLKENEKKNYLIFPCRTLKKVIFKTLNKISRLFCSINGSTSSIFKIKVGAFKELWVDLIPFLP
jgi:hypothetical protein